MPKAHIPAKDTIDLSAISWPECVSQLSVHVGWDKNVPEVQLGINGVDPVTGEPNTSSPFAPLDWQGCNRVIAALREARDQAFGKPE